MAHYRLFWQQFRSSFHTTGAVAPSGRALARALSHFIGQPGDGRQILEVGPGTGAVTQQVVRALGKSDRLDLVELNPAFVNCLERRFTDEAAFAAVAQRSRVIHDSVEHLPAGSQYDLIISGLPLNNFEVEVVEHFLDLFCQLLRPGGTLSFFEYMAVRPARSLVSGSAERARLRGIGRAMARLLDNHEIRRDWIWANLPPAWVHHVRLPAACEPARAPVLVH